VNPKVYLLAESGEGLRMRIKVEVNTRERSPADPVPLLPLRGAVSLVGRAGAIPRWSCTGLTDIPQAAVQAGKDVQDGDDGEEEASPPPCLHP